MGEIADMMIDGDMCPCGAYIGEGSGFPRYCSGQCARDYGGATARPKAKALNGFWLSIAEEIDKGRTRAEEIAGVLGMRRWSDVANAMEKMATVRLLARTGKTTFALTKKGREQMEAGRAALEPTP